VTFSYVFLKRLSNFGLSLPEVIKIGYFIESCREGREMIDAVLAGVEQNASLPTDYLSRFVATLPERPAIKEPANDRPARLSSGQRRDRSDQLVCRDGVGCQDCGCDESTIWRRQGLWTGDFGNYTKVHPTSNLEVDHKTPLWAGGDNELPNLWLLCIDCHKRKTALEAGQRRRA
jgi:hypothetical protein